MEGPEVLHKKFVEDLFNPKSTLHGFFSKVRINPSKNSEIFNAHITSYRKQALLKVLKEDYGWTLDIKPYQQTVINTYETPEHGDITVTLNLIFTGKAKKGDLLISGSKEFTKAFKELVKAKLKK